MYVGVWNGDGQLTAQLSDNSAVAYVDATPSDTTGPGAEVMYVYTLVYKAASAGQALTVEYVALRATPGDVSISAAALRTFDDTKTQIALPLDAPPVIDGVIDTAEWGRASVWQVTADPNLADGIRGGNTGDGAANPPADSSDLSFQIYAGYDANNLYVAVRVTDSVIQSDSAEANSVDSTTWMDDAVEVFIDGDNGNFEPRDQAQYLDGMGKNSTNSAQFVITANNAVYTYGTGGYGEDKFWFAKTAVRGDGTGYD
ncbi:MAG: hypothetical protein L0Z50_23485, partial [Verrucomicrobiales bacterium]|nr:hypothetical protein [Verrucomicrobiales bacterium]